MTNKYYYNIMFVTQFVIIVVIICVIIQSSFFVILFVIILIFCDYACHRDFRHCFLSYYCHCVRVIIRPLFVLFSCQCCLSSILSSCVVIFLSYVCQFLSSFPSPLVCRDCRYLLSCFRHYCCDMLSLISSSFLVSTFVTICSIFFCDYVFRPILQLSTSISQAFKSDFSVIFASDFELSSSTS